MKLLCCLNDCNCSMYVYINLVKTIKWLCIQQDARWTIDVKRIILKGSGRWIYADSCQRLPIQMTITRGHDFNLLRRKWIRLSYC